MGIPFSNGETFCLLTDTQETDNICLIATSNFIKRNDYYGSRYNRSSFWRDRSNDAEGFIISGNRTEGMAQIHISCYGPVD